MKTFPLLLIVAGSLLLASCASSADSPQTNKRDLIFTEKWDQARALVLEGFQAEGLKVTQDDIHDGWVYLLEGEGAEGYKVKVMIFKGENSVEGEITGVAPEGLLLWGDTPQTSLIRTLQEMSPGLTVRTPVEPQP